MKDAPKSSMASTGHGAGGYGGKKHWAGDGEGGKETAGEGVG